MDAIKRHSRKRDAILECLRSTTSHPSAEWIYAQLKPEFPDLSLGTVYRNLADFLENGEIITVGTVAGQERYDGAIRAHAHFVCTGCHAVLDLPEDLVSAALTPAENALSERMGVRLTGKSLLFSGLCPACLQ